MTVDDGGNYVTVYELNVRRIIGFIEALDLKRILNSAMEYADETVFTFAKAMVQVCVDQVMWCLQ